MSYWARNTSGLYNFKAIEAEMVRTRVLLSKSNTMLIDSETNKIYYNNDFVDNEYTDTLKKIQVIFSHEQHSASYLKCLNQQLDQNFRTWLRINNNNKDKSSRFVISEGSFLKFGRQVVQIANVNIATSLKAIERNMQRDENVEVRNESNNVSQDNDRYSNHSTTSLRCRICLDPETPDNPFETNLCFCSAKIPAHFSCLTKWLKRKCLLQSLDYLQLYDVGNMKCDVCAHPYPEETEIKGKRKRLLNIDDDMSKNCIVLNVYSTDVFEVRIVAVLQFTDKSSVFKFGRANNNDIVFQDISVSRLHAYLALHGSELIIYDNNSKFGTFALCADRIPMGEIIGKNLIIDKYCLSFYPNDKRHKVTYKDIIKDPVSHYQRLYMPRYQINNANQADVLSVKMTEASSINNSQRNQGRRVLHSEHEEPSEKKQPSISRLANQMLGDNTANRVGLNNPFARKIEPIEEEIVEKKSDNMSMEYQQKNTNTRINPDINTKSIDATNQNDGDKFTANVNEVTFNDLCKNNLVSRVSNKKMILSHEKAENSDIIRHASPNHNKNALAPGNIIFSPYKRLQIIKEERLLRQESDLSSHVRFRTNSEIFQFN